MAWIVNLYKSRLRIAHHLVNQPRVLTRMMKELRSSKLQEAYYRRKHSHNTEPGKPARTKDDGRKIMRGSTDTAQLTICSSMNSGMSTAASSATTHCCSSYAQHRVLEKGRLGKGATSIQPPQKSPPRGLPSS